VPVMTHTLPQADLPPLVSSLSSVPDIGHWPTITTGQLSPHRWMLVM
jgi:hypothetical protein